MVYVTRRLRSEPPFGVNEIAVGIPVGLVPPARTRTGAH
jgi:hypothetical protein